MGTGTSAGDGCLAPATTPGVDGTATAARPSSSAEPLPKAQQEAKKRFLQVERKREQVADLQGKRATPQAPPVVDKMSLEQLLALGKKYEEELESLEDQETALEAAKGPVVATLIMDTSKLSGAAAASACPAGVAAKKPAGKTAFGKLSDEEQNIMADPSLYVSHYCAEHEFGLRWDRTWQGVTMGPPDENTRRQRREGTKRKVVQELGLAQFGHPVQEVRKQQGAVHLFLDDSPASQLGLAPRGGQYLLGRYDVVAARVQADLDRSWNFMKGNKPEFWIMHAAALNIGESRWAEDFPDFSTQTNAVAELNEEEYFRAMEQILANAMFACAHLKTRHLVFFPFGMGAFLRHLGKVDGKYEDVAQVQRLRRRLAASFVNVIAKMSPKNMCIHLCLMFFEEETNLNADALLRAFAAQDKVAEKLRPLVTVHPEGDAMQVASELAEKDKSGVVLLNGANRQMLGNHWFAGRAKAAIDENLHRRSWRMAAMSYTINGYDGHEPTDRRPTELEENIRRIAPLNSVHKISHKKSWW